MALAGTNAISLRSFAEPIHTGAALDSELGMAKAAEARRAAEVASCDVLMEKNAANNAANAAAAASADK